MHQNSCFEKENHLISVWGHSFTLGGLLPPKRSFAVLWWPINCLCLREKGTKFGLNYPTVRLSVADYLCPYHSVVGSIYDPAHCSNNMFTHFTALM